MNKDFLKFRKRTFVAAALAVAAVTGAEARKVSGIVLDENGQPLAGATVREVPVNKNSSAHAVMVDHQGHFSFDIDDTSKSVVVSFVGYKPQTLTVGSDGKLKVQMIPTAESLSEVVVTGYQTLSKERATGSFAKINADDIKEQRISTVSDLLEGHVAGFNAGKLRGVTSMNGVTTPLYVIDGFPVEKTTNDGYGNWEDSTPNLNVEDIESITVLKDAAATSIYGARAANGVVVITTKRAQKGKTDISVQMNLTTQKYKTYTGRFADAATIIGLEKEWAKDNPYLQDAGAQDYAKSTLDNMQYTMPGMVAILKGYAGQMSKSEVDKLLANYASQGQRFYDEVDKYDRQNPIYQQYNVRIANANDVNSFTASMSFRDNRSSTVGNTNNSLGLSMQNSLKLASWVTFDAGLFVNFEKGNSRLADLASPGFETTPYSTLGTPANPYISRQEDRYGESQLNTISLYKLYNLDINPFEELNYGYNKRNDFSARTYARFNVSLTDWLRFTTQFQYEKGKYETATLQDKRSLSVRNMVNQYAVDKGGVAQFNLPYGNIYKRQFNGADNYNFRAQLDFNKTFAEDHRVTALAGFEMIENKNLYNNYTLYNYDPELLTYTLIDQKALNAGGGVWGWGMMTADNFAKDWELLNRFISYYGNAAYDYKGKYMATGSVRWDRTNLYASGSKYQKRPIWSVGAGWRIDQEEFMHGIDWLNMLKLRASYGIGGNIAKLSAPYLTMYYGTNNKVDLPQGNVGNRPNPNLRWEKTYTFNTGLEFAMFNNRLNGVVEFYNKRGVDLLANSNGVATEGFGFNTYVINNGKMTNRGVELTLNAVAYTDRDWTWTLNGTLGYNKNTVDYVNVEAPALFLQFDYPEAYPRVGVPYNAIYGFKWAGLSKDGAPRVYDAEGNIVEGMQPTQVKDAQYIGTSIPITTGSFGTSLRFRNFTLSMLFLYEGGHMMRNGNLPLWSGYGGWVSTEIANRWQKPGDEAFTDIPRINTAETPTYGWDNDNMYTRSSATVVKADNLRMRNLSLSYELPKQWASAVYMKNVRLMAGMENVFTLCANKDVKYFLGGYNNPNLVFSLNVDF